MLIWDPKFVHVYKLCVYVKKKTLNEIVVVNCPVPANNFFYDILFNNL